MGLLFSSKEEAGLCSQLLLPKGELLGGKALRVDSFSKHHMGTYCVQDGGQGGPQDRLAGSQSFQGTWRSQLGSLWQWEAHPLPETAHSRLSVLRAEVITELRSW